MHKPVRSSRLFAFGGGSHLARVLTGTSMVGALVGAAAPASQAAALRPTHISAVESPTTALVGHPLVVSGTALPILPGAPLTVLQLVAGRWRSVGHAHESATGAFSVAVKAPGTPGSIKLRVVRGATSSTRAGSSRTVLARAVTSALAVRAQAATTVVEGAPIVVTGEVSPKASGSVTLQRLHAGHWLRLAASRLTASRFTLVAARAGRHLPVACSQPGDHHQGGRGEPSPSPSMWSRPSRRPFPAVAADSPGGGPAARQLERRLPHPYRCSPSHSCTSPGRRPSR